MIDKKIYRGYDLETNDDGSCWVGKGGESRHFPTEAAAMDWIDKEKRNAQRSR